MKINLEEKIKMQSVKIIITGGTIDSEWCPSKDTAIVKETSSIQDYINKYIQPNCTFSYEVVAMKDSRDITQKIQNKIVSVIENSTEEHIIITHGTYTMSDTAKYLQNNLSKNALNKKIVLTGSFYPLEGFAPNDASFNLGFAIGVANFISSGVYVAMHSEVFEPENVKKDIERAHFNKK
ncbi:MAG: asparaginase domain-containing protein [Alphaproteobacteria bacterium]